MRFSQIFALLVVVLLVTLPEMAQAGMSRRSVRGNLNLKRGGSRSSYSSRYSTSSGGGSSRRGSPTWYYGVVIIPAADGTYYEGYGEECPGGCAIDGHCETEERCTSVARTNYFWFGVGCFIVLCAIWTICNDPKCCGKKEGSKKSHSSHSSAPNSVH